MEQPDSASDRRQTAADILREQRDAERRRKLMIFGPVAVTAALILAFVAFSISTDGGNDADASAAASELEGVEEFPDLPRNHVEDAVDYPQNPPVGGDHNPAWMNCGVYDAPVPSEKAVHSLEHGAVWISYDPALDQSDVDKLTALADGNSYVLVSPVDGIGSEIVATAWGKQMMIDGAADPSLETFVTAFAQGPQTPEPGAPCTGGVDS
ncbi:DUF3105 domain-containing protein [Nocardioides sp.]|uniref:DUF3105 domain-containing protein n=1 Tax=metagenome TaxID=256318 RepID=A0A2P2BX48_9ZZZZ